MIPDDVVLFVSDVFPYILLLNNNIIFSILLTLCQLIHSNISNISAKAWYLKIFLASKAGWINDINSIWN